MKINLKKILFALLLNLQLTQSMEQIDSIYKYINFLKSNMSPIEIEEAKIKEAKRAKEAKDHSDYLKASGLIEIKKEEIKEFEDINNKDDFLKALTFWNHRVRLFEFKISQELKKITHKALMNNKYFFELSIKKNNHKQLFDKLLNRKEKYDELTEFIAPNENDIIKMICKINSQKYMYGILNEAKNCQNLNFNEFRQSCKMFSELNEIGELGFRNNYKYVIYINKDNFKKKLVRIDDLPPSIYIIKENN